MLFCSLLPATRCDDDPWCASNMLALENMFLTCWLCVQVYAKMCANMRDMGASEEEVRRKVLQTLARKSTVMSPEHLLEWDIPITRTDQAAGEFVVTFPRTYHFGFSHGINLGESIKFALTEWYEYGTDAALRLTFLRSPPVRSSFLAP
jgi:hypothetical protein